jgi:hypothetical protein
LVAEFALTSINAKWTAPLKLVITVIEANPGRVESYFRAPLFNGEQRFGVNARRGNVSTGTITPSCRAVLTSASSVV